MLFDLNGYEVKCSQRHFEVLIIQNFHQENIRLKLQNRLTIIIVYLISYDDTIYAKKN